MAIATALGIAAIAVAFGLLELWRASLGLEPFTPAYLANRVLRLGITGPVDRESSLLFYVRPLTRWYAVALVALPFSLGVHRHQTGGRRRWLLELAWCWGAGLLLAFTAAQQRSYWFIHPLIPAGAWIVGATAAVALPPRGDRPVAIAIAVVATVWLGITLAIPERVRIHKPEQEAIRAADPPAIPEGAPRVVAHCGRLGAWRATHLFAFYWDATRVGCDAPAPLRFDGRRLHAHGAGANDRSP